MKNIFISVFLASLLYTIPCIAQTQSALEMLNQRASIPIPSPNVAALNKFVEFPVNHFNGQVDVSFPLYEIKLKNVSIPITLKYHTGGIRVNEEPSWVGLGWALDAGGMISHQIKGKDDIIYNLYKDYGQYFPYRNKTENETYTENKVWGALCLQGAKIPNKNGQMEDIISRFTSNYHLIDGEPDLFIYNMGNYSGKFINWDNMGVDLSCNNIAFRQYYGITSTGDSIVATDPDGNVYRFKNIEKSFSVTGLSSSEVDVNGFKENTSAYYLSEIVSSNGERIRFNYMTFKQLVSDSHWESYFPDFNRPTYIQNGYYPLIPALFEESSATYNMGSGVSSQCSHTNNIRLRAYTLVNTLYLNTIEFPGGTIEFIKSPRLDAYGLKLDRINIKNYTGQKIKTYEFKYDYFESSSIPSSNQDVMTATFVSASANINYPANFLKKRLKLTSFSEGNYDNSPIYSFTYNEAEKLPYKTSFAQDFWGYYNGAPNNTLLPSYTLYSSALGIPDAFGQGALSTKATADRNVNKNTIKACILKEITHPTKGKTIFDFEPNECINNSVSSTRMETRRFAAEDASIGFGRAEFTLGAKQKVNIFVTLHNGANIPLGTATSVYLGSPYDHDANGFYAVIEKYNPSMNRFECFDTRYFWSMYYLKQNPGSYPPQLIDQELQPGRYRLTASFPDYQKDKGGLGSTFVSLSVLYDELVTTIANNNLVGGLRIKQITHTDIVTNKSITTNYTYKNGILATHPSHRSDNVSPLPCDQYAIQTGTEWGFVKSLTANPVYPYSFSANGSLVGYKNVTETYSNGEFGKVEYEYKMESDVMAAGGTPWPYTSYPQGTPSTPKLTNGFMLSKTVYDNNQKLLNKKEFNYAIVNAKVYWGFKIDSWVSYPYSPCLGAVCYSSGCHDEYAGRMKVYFYPIIQGKVLIKQEDEEVYNPPGQMPPLQRKIEYEYNTYCQLTSKKIDNSVSGKVIETYKYVPEKAVEWGGVYTQMKSKNIISPLIETSTNQNGATTKQVTNYSQQYTNVFMPFSFQLGNATTLETRIYYDKYDKFGNLNSVNRDNTGNIIYLWSYNGLYPVAEIRYSNYATVDAALSTVGLGSIEALSKNVNPDKKKLDNLRTVSTLVNTHITTYKYSPLIGILEVTSPSGVTTYYEYDSFNRLQTIKDGNNKSVESYEYHYKN